MLCRITCLLLIVLLPFAVFAEEFGFIGATFLVLLFVAFLVQSIRISLMTKDVFGGLLITGIAILIVSQSFLNIASMLGIFPMLMQIRMGK